MDARDLDGSYEELSKGLDTFLETSHDKLPSTDLALELDDIALELRFWRLQIGRDPTFRSLEALPERKVRDAIASSILEGLRSLSDLTAISMTERKRDDEERATESRRLLHGLRETITRLDELADVANFFGDHPQVNLKSSERAAIDSREAHLVENSTDATTVHNAAGTAKDLTSTEEHIQPLHDTHSAQSFNVGGRSDPWPYTTTISSPSRSHTEAQSGIATQGDPIQKDAKLHKEREDHRRRLDEEKKRQVRILADSDRKYREKEQRQAAKEAKSRQRQAEEDLQARIERGRLEESSRQQRLRTLEQDAARLRESVMAQIRDDAGNDSSRERHRQASLKAVEQAITSTEGFHTASASSYSDFIDEMDRSPDSHDNSGDKVYR